MSRQRAEECHYFIPDSGSRQEICGKYDYVCVLCKGATHCSSHTTKRERHLEDFMSGADAFKEAMNAGKIVDAAWILNRLSNMLTDAEILAAFGKKIVRGENFMEQRLVDIDKEG